ncbi:GumC family protein [Pelagibacterium luteolum]|uniref:Uncharacterized protein involved in exopolysaccharide biosynthesis n=1 Tax=Pelagibacterium luteolum TaxID=440168 RepID=A0A1G7WF27_9HYPH|nr:GumC family protein [Pelagibacterium luteolum]SDG70508.1 Uncharacterized protein involved in exopolysaccharide biosynthesis [Pelagibacterium luteolum]
MSDSGSAPDQVDTSIDAGLILRAVLRSLIRIAFITLLLCAAAYAVLLFVPRVYESRAELLVEPRSNSALSSSVASGSDAYLLDAAAVASQIELIKSRDTIRAAIETLNLEDDPAFTGQNLDRIIAGISDDLIVTQERGSRLISIAYRSEDPDMAALIANGIALAHVSRRAGQQISDTIETTGWLEDEIGRLRASVGAAERAIAEFRVDNDLFVGSNNESLTNQQLSNFTAQMSAAAERRSTAQSRAQLIRALLESGQSVIGVSDVQSSSVGQQLSQEVARLQGERAQQAATLLPNHPTIRALDAQIAEIDTQISAEGRRIAAALEAQAQIEADLQTSLQAELDRLKVTAGTDTIEGVTLAELEREATAQRELLNAYLLGFAEASARSDVNSALPDIRIVSEAAPPVRPAAPQTMMILVAIAIVSILLQVGAVIFSELLSGRALVEKHPVAPRRPEVNDEQLEADDVHVAPTPVASVRRHHTPVSLETEIEAIAAGALGGIERILVIATDDARIDTQDFADKLTAKLINDQLSVAEIDASSGQQGIEPGLSDLSVDEAEFGDVVHRAPNGQFAYVPWGQSARLNRNSDRMATLVDALSDIYECVVIVTGRTGMGSSLPLFAETGAQCLLLSSEEVTGDAAKDEILELGYESVHLIVLPGARSEVA